MTPAEPATPVAVVGGGIAGLSAALSLHERGHRFLLFEARDDLGGVIRTERHPGFLVEGGPDSFLVQKPEAMALVRALHLDGHLVATNPEARSVFVLRGGRLFPMPEGMTLTVPTRVWPVLASPLFSWGGKLRMGLDLVRPARRGDDDESIASFVRRRFGAEMLDRVAEPLLAGIHAGDPETLSLRATFPRLAALEQAHGSVVRGLRAAPPPASAFPSAFASLQGGLGELVEALRARLPPGDVRTSCRVRTLRREGSGFALRLESGVESTFRAVLVALPAPAASDLTREVAADAASLLSGIRFASTVVLVLGYRREDVGHPLVGYGLLVPRGQGLRTTALSFHSTKLEGRVPAGQVMLRVFLGGIQDGGVVDLTDADLLEIARREMGPVLGLRGEPTLFRVFRWPHATPQMEVGHGERVARIEQAMAAVPGLFLTGGGLRGTGLPDTIGDAQRTAAAAAAFLERR